MLAAGCSHGGSRPQAILFLSDRDGDWALYAMDANDRNQHRVMSAGRPDPFGEGFGFGEPLVSPDGTNVLLERNGVTLASLTTGATRRLGPGEESDAGWSPDGTQVAFAGPGDTGLSIVDVRNGARRRLLHGSVAWVPTWSPDGKWIAFGRQIGYGNPHVWAIHPDGSGLRRVAPVKWADGMSWSRDGRLAFMSLRLVIADLRTGQFHVTGPRLGGGSLAWSPNGRTLAYATTNDAGISTIYTTDGHGPPRRLTPADSRVSDSLPVWSRDGKSLLFTRTPLGGGVRRGLPQIWTMRANGSNRRGLTSAYPDGGDNVEPHWIGAPVHTEARPRAKEVLGVLRVPFAVDGIAAAGGRAVIVPSGHETTVEEVRTPPVLLWRPGQGVVRLNASACGAAEQPVLTATRLAFDCSSTFIDLLYQLVWVYDLHTRVPREVFAAASGGARSQGLFVDNVVGRNGLIFFGSDKTDERGRPRHRALWRIDRFDSVSISARRTTGMVAAAGDGNLASVQRDGRIAILGTDGALLRTLPLRAKPPFLLAGLNLLVIEHRQLRAYDTYTGALRWERQVPRGAHLEDANAHAVVYTAGTAIHIVSGNRERVVHAGSNPHAALTRAGLFYCFNVRDRRFPGRTGYMPIE